MSEKPPREVQESIRTGNIEHLRAAGRKGAEKTNIIKDVKRAIKEEFRDRGIEEERELRHSTNEDILSADGEEPS